MTWEDERDSAMLPTNITYNYISYELQSFLAVHKLFRNGNVSLFTNFKFGFLNFSSLQKSTTPIIVGFTTEGFISYVTINDNDSCFEGMQYIFHEHIKVNPCPAKYQYQTQRVPAPEGMLLMALNGLKQMKTIIQKFLKRPI